MNLSKPVLGVLGIMLFLFMSNSTFAQVTSFVPEAEAISILNTSKSSSEAGLSSLNEPLVADYSDVQAFQAAWQAYNAQAADLEFALSVSEKMLLQMSSHGSTPEVVKISLVSLLEELENTSINAASYAYANQNLSQNSARINDYVLELLGE